MRLLDALLPARSDPAQGLDPFSGFGVYSHNGNTYVVPQTTMSTDKTEAIGNNYQGYVSGGLFGNGVIFGLESTRLRVFSQARIMFQKMNKGRPGDLWSSIDLGLIESPWPGGTTSDLLALALLHADFGGSAYGTVIDDEIVMMRPDWIEIVLGKRESSIGQVGKKKLGYLYYEGGKNQGADPVPFIAEEVFHFAPMPDPLASYRGMSWLTPVVREIQSDSAFTNFKLKFTENAATPNLAVSLKEITDPDQFAAFVDKMDETHRGWENAYKTLYLGAGADVTVVGSNLSQLDFKAVQGAGETRLAQAAGVHPVVAAISEGMQGSSLNAGNFGQGRRHFADITCAHLWQNFAGSLARIIPVQSGSRLWYDADIPFLREDAKDAADIQSAQAQAIRELFMSGFTPESSVAAVTAGDMTLLEHTGTYSIQVQAPGAPKLGVPPDGGDSQNPVGAGVTDKVQPPALANGKPPARHLAVVRDGNGDIVGLEESFR